MTIAVMAENVVGIETDIFGLHILLWPKATSFEKSQNVICGPRPPKFDVDES